MIGGDLQKIASSVKKPASCCSSAEKPDNGNACGEPHSPDIAAHPVQPVTVSTEWTWEDHAGQIRCRLTSFRDRYSVAPGLYAVGKPDKNSDVLVSANYKLSFDILRRSLKGMNVWILVLDTKGINVWCAAGKGTFGTDELVNRISVTGLKDIIGHNRIILPQLGAPGVAAHQVKKRTGFIVHYGPIHAHDIPRYIEAGYTATKEMRAMSFTLLDRLILTPMELNPALKQFPLYALLVLVVFGLKPQGILFKDAWVGGLPFLLIGLITVVAGAFVTPLLLPAVPSRSFAVKGWIMGTIMLAASAGLTGVFEMEKTLRIITFLLFPVLSSYIALQFTGSTVFTGMSGVKKELKYAIPIYLVTAGISLLLLVFYKLKEMGVV